MSSILDIGNPEENQKNAENSPTIYLVDNSSTKRLLIPKPIREAFWKAEYAMLYDPSIQALVILSPASLERLTSRIRSLTLTDPNIRPLQRFIAASLFYICLDGRGRVIIPQFLVHDFQLKNHLVFETRGSDFIVWTRAGFTDRNRNISIE
jgi:DNA-binding transcriptional regulator/RsmH inhibitor MraZ